MTRSNKKNNNKNNEHKETDDSVMDQPCITEFTTISTPMEIDIDTQKRKRKNPNNNGKTAESTQDSEEEDKTVNTVSPDPKKPRAKNSHEDESPVFLKVNARSKHRRECLRYKDFDDQPREETPERNNRSEYKHIFVTRISARLQIPSSQTPEIAYINIIKQLFHEMKKADRRIHIYPWSERDDGIQTRIKDSQSFNPESLNELSKHSHKLFLHRGNAQQTHYPQFRIGHDVDMNSILETMSNWLNKSRHGIYENMLQAERSNEIGWLLYSTQQMDAGALADEISTAIKKDIGLRWKMIPVGNNKKLNQAQIVKALVVEVETEHQWYCQRKLLALYGRDKKPAYQYPNGIRFRFVKLKKNCTNMHEKAKIDKIRDRQKAFLKSICRSNTEDLTCIDLAYGDDPTIRQMIMQIKSKKYPGVPLFHAVDLDWRALGFVFQYTRIMSEEAEVMMNNLLPYLEGNYPDVMVSQSFSAECLDRCVHMEYDEEMIL